jgi:hypothetical protein
VSASTPKRFPALLITAIDSGKLLGIKAGRGAHRIIRIWAVVVEGRVFVRSWSRKPRSWWRTFLTDPIGLIEVGSRTVPVRAKQTRSERLKDAVDEAYLAKYGTGGSLRYARDLGRRESRATTTELIPR